MKFLWFYLFIFGWCSLWLLTAKSSDFLFLFIYLFIFYLYLFICLSIYLFKFIYLFICLFMYLFIYLFTYLFIYLSIYLFIYLFIYLSIYYTINYSSFIFSKYEGPRNIRNNMSLLLDTQQSYFVSQYWFWCNIWFAKIFHYKMRQISLLNARAILLQSATSLLQNVSILL